MFDKNDGAGPIDTVYSQLRNTRQNGGRTSGKQETELTSPRSEAILPVNTNAVAKQYI